MRADWRGRGPIARARLASQEPITGELVGRRAVAARLRETERLSCQLGWGMGMGMGMGMEGARGGREGEGAVGGGWGGAAKKPGALLGSLPQWRASQEPAWW